jgi:hypothetical protein
MKLSASKSLSLLMAVSERRKARSSVALCLLMWVISSGCATAPPSKEEIAKLDYGERPVSYEWVIKNYFNDVLFDPYSAQYEFRTPERVWLKEPGLGGGQLYGGYLVIVGVNAKNRLGGYVGRTTYGFLINKGQIVKVLDEYDLENSMVGKTEETQSTRPPQLLKFKLHQ